MKRKNLFAKAFGIFLAFILAINTFPMNVLADDDDDEISDELKNRVEHTDKNFEDLEIHDVSEAGFDSIVQNIEALTDDESNSDLVMQYVDDMISYYNLISENNSLSYIYTSLDANDEKAEEEYKKWDAMSTNVYDKMMIAFHTIASSPCSSYLEEFIDDADDWQDIIEYEPLTDRQKELTKEETELSLQYADLDNKSYTCEINGKEYTYDELVDASNDGTIDQMALLDGLTVILKAQNQDRAELYIKLVENRTEFARSKGYNNYADYAYEKRFDRDYTHADLKEFQAQVKTYYSPLLQILYSEFSGVRDEYNKVSEMDMSFEECCRLLSSHFDEISPALWESFNYMVDHNLCNMEIDDNKAPGGYTTNLSGEYNSVFIFNDADGSVQDLCTLIHEFGHYNQMYYGDEKEWKFGLCNLDLAEIHSQGLEALYDAYATELYGDGAHAMEVYSSLNSVYSVVEGCLQDEFQYQVYANPDNLTVDSLNELYYELSVEYGENTLCDSYYLGLYGKIPSGQIYEWANIHHTFDQPVYYISYAISMGAVEELKDVIKNDRQDGISKYLKLVNVGSDGKFQETLEKVGINNPIKNPRFGQYAYNTLESLGLDTSMIDSWDGGAFTSSIGQSTPDVITTPDSTDDIVTTDRDTDHSRPEGKSEKTSLPLFVILILAIVAGVAFIAIIILIICLVKSGKKKNKENPPMTNIPPVMPQAPVQNEPPVIGGAQVMNEPPVIGGAQAINEPPVIGGAPVQNETSESNNNNQ